MLFGHFTKNSLRVSSVPGTSPAPKGLKVAMPTPLPHKQIIKKRTLKFPRYQSDEQIKVKSSWRRPRGIDSRHRCRYVLPPPLEPCLRQRCRAGLWQGRPRTRAWLRVA